mmetsp:Transcript_12407/g.34150  ORF Transcript_12407/g.34150 Transcript_12407/m.34150 type:complete len:327 (-) Transcript_12407:1042-2022(-)
MSSKTTCGRSARLSTGRSLVQPVSLPILAAARQVLAQRPTSGVPGELPVLGNDDTGDASASGGSACIAFRAASKRSRVVKPIQKPDALTTGKSTTLAGASSAFVTTSRDALGGKTASGGMLSQRNFAGTPSIAFGGSGRRKGIFFLIICSSSKPRSLMHWFRKSDTVTLHIRGGTRLSAPAQPLMKMTTATDICLKPHSMAALPTMAYTPVTARPPKPFWWTVQPTMRPARPPMSMEPVKLPEGTGTPVRPMFSAVYARKAYNSLRQWSWPMFVVENSLFTEASVVVSNSEATGLYSFSLQLKRTNSSPVCSSAFAKQDPIKAVRA